MPLIGGLLTIIAKKIGSVAGTVAMLAAFAAFVASFVAISEAVKVMANMLPPSWICGLSAFGVLTSIKIGFSMIATALGVRFTRFLAARLADTMAV